MAHPGLLDVSGHECRPARARPALRLDLEPQLRGPPGPWRPHAPRQPGDGSRGRDRAPEAGPAFDAAVAEWRELSTDEDAVFDAEVHIDADTLTPFVTWGTNPGQGSPLGASVPDPAGFADEADRLAAEKALAYMGLEAGTPSSSRAARSARSRWKAA